MYGPKQVILVAGVNKIVPDLAAGVRRAKEVAPLNCRRLHHTTPCAESGVCEACNSACRMCNHLGITLNAWKFPGRLQVVLVAERWDFKASLTAKIHVSS